CHTPSSLRSSTAPLTPSAPWASDETDLANARCQDGSMGLQVHLVDGTYELFRYHYSPANKDPVRGATRGVIASCLMLLEQGATHVAVATDHVIESFRNDLWAGYKDGSGIDRDLRNQFNAVEDALRAAGFPVWAMV